MENTTWLCGQPAKTCVLTNSRQITERFAEHEGQKPRRRQENASKYSFLHFSHRTLAKPFFNTPQSMNFSTVDRTIDRHLPKCFSKRNSYSAAKRSSNERAPNRKDSFLDVWVYRPSRFCVDTLCPSRAASIKSEANSAQGLIVLARYNFPAQSQSERC